MDAIVGLFFLMVFAIAAMAICRKAGYSMWWGLVILVPILNLFFLAIFVLKPWPIERELARLRLGIKSPVRHTPGFPVLQSDADTAPIHQQRQADLNDAAAVFSEALQFERRGEWEAAISLYDQLAAQLTDTQDGQYARNCADTLRKRLPHAHSES